MIADPIPHLVEPPDVRSGRAGSQRLRVGRVSVLVVQAILPFDEKIVGSGSRRAVRGYALKRFDFRLISRAGGTIGASSEAKPVAIETKLVRGGQRDCPGRSILRNGAIASRDRRES